MRKTMRKKTNQTEENKNTNKQEKRKVLLIWIFVVLATIFLEGYYIQSNQTMGQTTLLPTADREGQRLNHTQILQSFQCPADRLEGLILNVECDRTATDVGSVEVVLQQGQQTVEQWSFDQYELTDSYKKLVLSRPLEDVKGEDFNLIISSKKDSGLVFCLSGDQSASGAQRLIVEGEEIEGAGLCFSIVENNVRARNIYLLTVLFTVLVFAALFYFMEMRGGMQIEFLFAGCYLVLGICMLFAIPMFKTPDEDNHFFRAYEISTCELVSQKNLDETAAGVEAAGASLPEVMETVKDYNCSNSKIYNMKEISSLDVDKEKTSFITFGNTALYAPGTYLPQAVGISVARFFTKNVIIMAYAGRILNWLTIGVLLFLSLRFLPFGKNLVFLLTFIPMNVQQFNSLSPDGMVFAIIMVLLTFILYQRYTAKRELNRKEYLLIYLFVFLLCQCKIVYLPLCLLLFLIPKERFGTTKKYAGSILGVAAVGGITGISWLAISSGFLSEFQPGVSSSEQLVYILREPVHFLMTIIRTFDISGEEWIWQGMGQMLGWINIRTSFTVLVFYLLLILWVWMLDNDTKKINISSGSKALLFGAAAFTILLIYLSLYIQWSAYHNNTIAGIQGRYFLPLLFPLLLSLKPAASMLGNHKFNCRLMVPAAMGVNLVIAVILLSYAV